MTSEPANRGDDPTADGATPTEAFPAYPEPDPTPGIGEADAPAAAEEPGEKAWWDNPAFPWQGKPTRADLGCMWAIMGMGIFGLVMLPIRPVVLAMNPYISGAINGGSVSMASIGARAATHMDPSWMWILGLVIGTLSVIKFDWIFWWAGRLWGDRLIDYLLQNRGAMAKRNAQRAQRITHKYETLAMAITYVPFIPFPSAIVYGALGIAGTSLRKFLLLDISLAVITRGIYMYIGYRIGEPAIAALQEFGKYSWYVSIALIIGIFVMMFLRNGRKKAPVPSGADDGAPRGAAQDGEADPDQVDPVIRNPLDPRPGSMGPDRKY